MKKEPLSKKILQQSFLFNEEHFWKYEEALRVVEELSKDYYAIVGVELYTMKGESLQWDRTSDYSHDISLPWDQYVHLCKIDAISFIQKNKNISSTVFNFSFISEVERSL